MHPLLIVYTALALVAARLLFFIFKSVTSPLRDIPGPLLSRLNRLWYLRQVYHGNFHQENIALHKQYGPIVRLAPDLYSIDQPEKTIYGISSKFPKSDWYDGWNPGGPEWWSLFTDKNIKHHSEERRKFTTLYSMSSLVSFEAYVDNCIDIFKERLKEFAASGKVLDMGHWFQCYAFDVIGEITYSKRFGFLDEGQDIEGMMAALHQNMIFSTCSGIYPAFHPYLYALTAKLPGSGAAGRIFLSNFASQRIAARKEDRKKGEDSPDELNENGPRDFLGKILDKRDEDPVKVTDYHVFLMNMSNIIAGSDTTAVSLSSVLYHLLKTPETLKKLREEIKQCEEEGAIGEMNIRFSQSQKMPYLQAVIKEGLRLHSATGLPLWRVVPEGGAEICGRFFPAGTKVGLNTWVAHFDKEVFGDDVEKFRPERWIEAEREGGELLKKMDAYYLPFGLGSRTCIGRHIGELEMAKLIPELVRTFDFELQDPKRQWKTENYWFVKPVGFDLKVKELPASKK